MEGKCVFWRRIPSDENGNTWSDVRKICSNENGTLAMLKTQEEIHAMEYAMKRNLLLKSFSGFYVGLLRGKYDQNSMYRYLKICSKANKGQNMKLQLWSSH